MYHFYANDGRILTPPGELEPLLKDSFPAFIEFLDHIRFFCIMDEIWDGKSSLIFHADSEQLATVMLYDGFFNLHTNNEDFDVADKSVLQNIYDVLREKFPRVCIVRLNSLALAAHRMNVLAVIAVIYVLVINVIRKTSLRKMIIFLIQIGSVITIVYRE